MPYGAKKGNGSFEGYITAVRKYGIQICRKVCYNKTHSRFRKTVNGTENIRMSVSVYFTFN